MSEAHDGTKAESENLNPLRKTRSSVEPSSLQHVIRQAFKPAARETWELEM